MPDQRCLLSLAALFALSSACSSSSRPGFQQSSKLSFQDAVYLETTSETSANASLGDLDGDGDLDIVLAKGRHWPLLDIVLVNDGSGRAIRGSKYAVPQFRVVMMRRGAIHQVR